ncbi:sensor histidine kinase [Cereibacter johrii]|uniref:histidine kinase n=1 Tax=Cereibacter johrii TaxID=445629 RepID=A0ABX5J8Y7_9RHOB|nr:histidine kinase dimerization/phosphoacceptor domain -containing protein [Cereibacter johrii]ODM41460.1 histidine kinase [Cereibacter johrii]PTM78270.1 two-component sensor histidine kinase [Cereibacter johrii]
MRDIISPAGKTLRSTHFIALRMGAAILAVLGMVIWAVWSWNEEVAALEEQGQSKARLISLYVERLVQTQVILQQAALRDMRDQGPDYLTSPLFETFLTAIESAQTSSGGIAVHGPDGPVLAQGSRYPSDFRFPIEAFRAARAAGWTVFVGRVETADPVDDRLFVATDFSDKGQDAIFVSMLTLGSIRAFLQQIAPSTTDAASLLRTDGYLLLRRNATRPIMLDETATVVKETEGRISGSYRAVSISDGTDRLYSFTRVADLPLVAIYGAPVSEIRAGWLWRVVPIWMFLGLLALFIFVLSGRIRRAMELSVIALETRQQLEATQKIAEQRARLMQELSHRVKNNLALVLALIDRQIRTRGRIEALELRGRIMAIAEVHSMLFAAGERYDLDFGRLIERLSISEALVPPERPITVDRDVEEGIRIGPDSAVPLALVAAELLTNAVKHAFPDGRPGRIRVSLHRVGADTARLEIADDGVGLPAGADPKPSGLAIVEALVAQADAVLERRDEGGACFRLTFPIRGHTTADLPSRTLERKAG